MGESDVRIEGLDTLRAAYVHTLSDNPEEEAGGKILAWARSKGLFEEGSGARLFGRNTYPTKEPEPHGYEFYLTIGAEMGTEGIEVNEVPGGLYAVLKFTGLENIGEAWKRLFAWIEESEYEHQGWIKGKHGWANGFEEHLNFRDGGPQNRWVFDLWARLKD